MAGEAPAGQGRRVLIVVENLPVPFDRRVWLEATTLAAAGYTVSVISPKGKGFDADYEVLDGVHVYRHPMPPDGNGALGYLREYAAALRHELRLAFRVRREQGVDVLQGCNPPDLVFLVAWALRPFGVTLPLRPPRRLPRALRDQVRPPRRALAADAALRVADLPHRHGLDRHQRQLRRDRPRPRRHGGRGRLRGALGARGSRASRSARPSRGSSGARHLVGWVGVIGQQEGLDLLVAAADHLVRGLGRDDVRFAVIGFGPHQPAIEADVAARGLAAHFVFTGPQYGDDLLAWLNTADVCVSPDPKTAMNDISTMNKVIEYMTLAKPVVQFDLKEGRASAGEAALYARPNDPVDFAEKIAELIDDPARRARMGAIGRARVEGGLSWAHSAPRLLAAYDRAFAKRAADERRRHSRCRRPRRRRAGPMAGAHRPRCSRSWWSATTPGR